MDILINNAGLIKNEYCLTEDGFEETIAANHLGHFQLTNLLIPLLKKSNEPRVINVSSEAHDFPKKIDFDDVFSK